MILPVNSAVALSFLWLGWRISREDRRTGLIINSRIILGFEICAAALAALFIFTLLAEYGLLSGALARQAPARGFYPGLARHFALTVLSAVLLWKVKAWPAGDAKLFIVFSCMLAIIMVPGTPRFPDRLFLSVLINIYVPAGVFYLASLAAPGAAETIPVSVSDLKQGMVLSADSIGELRKDRAFFKEHFSDLYCDGLTGGQIEALRSVKRQAEVRICRGTPFAAWIFGGTLLTLVLRRDIITQIGRLWRSI